MLGAEKHSDLEEAMKTLRLTVVNLALTALLGSSLVPQGQAAAQQAQPSPEYRIRGLRWGASAEEIRAIEKAPLKHESASGAVGYLVYSDNYLGEPVSVVYKLIRNKLYQISYNFESGARKCADLTKKFEEASADVAQKNGAQGTTEGEGCNRTNQWTIGDTGVSVRLSTDSGRSDLAVVSTSEELAHFAEESVVTTTTTKVAR